MKGCGTSVAPVTSGVRSDVERLLQKFIEIPSVRYDHFARCFREMKFSLIFAGRTSENEMKEFTEKTLSLVLSYCYPPYSFQVNVGAIYLLYALYYLQPKKYKMHIRITPEQMEMLNSLRHDLLEKEHHDTCYVLLKLGRDQAFFVVAYPEERNPMNFHRFDSKEEIEQAVETLRNTETYINEVSDDKLIPQIETLHDQYSNLKRRFYDESKYPEAMALIKDNPVPYIRTLINEAEAKLELKTRSGKRKKICDDGTVEVVNVAEENRCKPLARRSEIKHRAYFSKVTVHRRRGRSIIENPIGEQPSGTTKEKSIYEKLTTEKSADEKTIAKKPSISRKRKNLSTEKASSSRKATTSSSKKPQNEKATTVVTKKSQQKKETPNTVKQAKKEKWSKK